MGRNHDDDDDDDDDDWCVMMSSIYSCTNLMYRHKNGKLPTFSFLSLLLAD